LFDLEASTTLSKTFLNACVMNFLQRFCAQKFGHLKLQLWN